nr:uncharacterized protein LOC112735103 [Arachis hypogaea]
MAAITNLENTMQANTVATMQAMKRMGQPTGNGNGNGNGNREGDGNNLGGAPMTLASFLKVHPLTFQGTTNSTEADNWGEAQHWWQGECQLLRVFSELVNKARVVKGCAKKVALARDPRGGNNNRERGKYFQPKAQNFKRGGDVVDSNADCLVTWRGIVLVRGARMRVEDLGLKISKVAFDFHVHTTYQIVVTISGCKEVTFKIEDREFVHDLIYLLIVGLEIILGFDWLLKNWILLDCFERSIRFLPEGEGRAVVAEGYYLNSVLVNCIGEECQGYILLAVNVLGDEQRLDQILVVREFSEVFAEDIPISLLKGRLNLLLTWYQESDQHRLCHTGWLP